jgi:hypothetical protein
VRVRKPALDVERAILAVRAGYIYRPVCACFLVWLTSFSFSSFARAGQPVVVAISETTTTSADAIDLAAKPDVKNQTMSQRLVKFIVSLITVVPPPVAICDVAKIIETIEDEHHCLRLIFLTKQVVRAPPVAVKEFKGKLLSCAHS